MNSKKMIATVIAAVAVLAPAAAAAQGGLATLAGTARDQSGAAVPSATVTVTNEKNGGERVATAGPQTRAVDEHVARLQVAVQHRAAMAMRHRVAQAKKQRQSRG